MFEYFKMETEEIGYWDIATCIEDAHTTDDIWFLSNVIDTVDDQLQKDILKERLLKKQLGWL